MRRVLLSTDFSENAQHAIDYALLLFRDEEVNYYLFNSYGLTGNISETLISLEDILHEQSEKSLKAGRDSLVAIHQKLQIETISVNGEPLEAIKNAVIQRDIDVVVLGSSGKGAFNGSVFGSTTTHLVRRISQPILIVPLHFTLKAPKKIVLCTDLVQGKDFNTFEPMLSLARKHGAEVIVMNVTGSSDNHLVKQALKRLDFNNHFEGIKYSFEAVQNGDILKGIDDFITVEKADLLVLSPKQYPYFGNLFHRSVTKQMVRRSDIPIMVI